MSFGKQLSFLHKFRFFISHLRMLLGILGLVKQGVFLYWEGDGKYNLMTIRDSGLHFWATCILLY